MPPNIEDAAAPSSNNPWFAVSLGLFGLIVGYSVGTGLSAPSAPSQAAQVAQQQPSSVAAVVPEQPQGTAPETGVGPVLGDASAEITLVEFTDFQCPFCSRHFSQTFGQIKENYVDTGKVKYELRHYPLPFHPNAQISAEASMCAATQSKFWEMHDELFAKQQEWSGLTNADAVAKFKEYAASLGLDSAKFASCMQNHETKDAIQADMDAAGPAGVDGTPGFWIIGPNAKTQFISGAYPYDTFASAFDEMLQ
jgi:protein-disulfide isomerase